MKIDKWLYFRTVADEDNDDGDTASAGTSPTSICFPASAIMGIAPSSDTAISLFLKPIRKTQTAEAQTGDADPDVIVLACAQYGQKLLLKKLLSKINGGPHDDNLITLYDGYTNIAAGEPVSDIGATGITIVAAQVAAD